MQGKKKSILPISVFLLALLLFIVCASNILMPKRYELGANWGAFTAEEANSMDVVFFGSSLAYCNVIPSVIWEESGISTYVMAGPEQTVATTYYYVEEMFRTQSPSAVMVELGSVRYDSTDGQDSVKVNIGYMPYDLTRVKATFGAAPPDQRLGLLFPLYNYHDRWNQLTADDFRLGLNGYDRDMLAGYNYLDKCVPQKEIRHYNFQQTDEEYAANISWLQKIAQLCASHNCRCIFYSTASYAYFEDSYWQKLNADLTPWGGEMLNCSQDIDLLNIDPDSDFCDILHFNYRGAVKNSRYLADKLADMDIKASEPYADEQLWQERSAYLQQLIAAGEAAQ